MLFVSTFLLLGGLSWETPWSSGTSSDITPWSGHYSRSRKEGREYFFRMLERDQSAGSRAESRVELKENREVGDEDAEGSRAIAALPWGDYESRDKRVWSTGNALLWPVPYGKLGSVFGSRGSGFHEGVDIRAPNGTRVRAAAAGVVVYSSWIRGYGNTIVISHGDGLTTIYAHNAENIKSVGDRVEQGDTLALVGQTGQATGPHLHFEVRKRGRANNPLDYSYLRTPVAALQSDSTSDAR